MLTIYLLTSDFESSPKRDLNNLQWLRKQDKVNGRVFVSPYVESDYFMEQFILPLLDKEFYIDERYFNVPCVTSDGVSYCVKKWHEKQYRERFAWMRPLTKADMDIVHEICERDRKFLRDMNKRAENLIKQIKK